MKPFKEERARVARTVVRMERNGATRTERSGEMSLTLADYLATLDERGASGEHRESIRTHLLGLGFRVSAGLEGSRFFIEASDFRALKMRFAKES